MIPVELLVIGGFAAFLLFLGFMVGFCVGWMDAENQYGYKLPFK